MKNNLTEIMSRFVTRNRLIPLVLIVLLVSVLPIIKETVVPEWQIQVVDEKGNPLQNEPITQTWKDYSLEFWASEGHEETKKTDLNGYVVFPKRTIYISILSFTVGRFRDLMPRINPHSSYGKYSYVSCPYKIKCNAFYKEGSDLPSRIIVPK